MVETRCLAEDVGPGTGMGSRRVGVRTSVLPAEIGSRWCKFCETSSSPGQSIARSNPLANNGAQLHWHAPSQLARSLLVAGKVLWRTRRDGKEGIEEASNR